MMGRVVGGGGAGVAGHTDTMGDETGYTLSDPISPCPRVAFSAGFCRLVWRAIAPVTAAQVPVMATAPTLTKLTFGAMVCGFSSSTTVLHAGAARQWVDRIRAGQLTR